MPSDIPDTPMEKGPELNGEKEPEGRELEGEGSYRGARQYDDEAERFARSGKVDEAADKAASAFDGSEGTELREAEQEGKRHAAEEDPLLREDRDPPEYPGRKR